MRFFDALLEFEGIMKSIAGSAPSTEGRDIISGQIMIARDPGLSDAVLSLIDSGMDAASALNDACDDYDDKLRKSGDEIAVARCEDLAEVRNGILSAMNKAEGKTGTEEDGDIIFADSLSAAEIIGFKNSGIKAVVMRSGTKASHAAVILRSMNIVSVFGTEFDPADIIPGKEAIVDGTSGLVITSPSEAEKQSYNVKAEAVRMERSSPKEEYTGICRTMDDVEVRILCNIGSGIVSSDAALSDGAGLVRTEFVFMGEERAPSEEEQALVYEKIADHFPGKNVVIRTLDIGGDKYFGKKMSRGAYSEENPALGVRGVRMSLMDPESFACQISAILRASAGRDICILIPMVTNREEIVEVRFVIENCKRELELKGVPFDGEIRLGCMIETPAAVLCAGDIAGDVDFFSIGTNDLAQYIMCADRCNPHMSALCSVYQPAVIKCLKMVCDKALEAGIPVTVCGEAASDTEMLPVFLGFGIKSFSVEPSCIVKIKNAVKKLNFWSCSQIADMILEADSEEKVRNILSL